MSRQPDEIYRKSVEGVLHDAVEHATGFVFHQPIATQIIAALKTAGYTISLDETALLKKGEDSGVKLAADTTSSSNQWPRYLTKP